MTRRLFRLPAATRRVAREVDDELAFHIAARVDDLVAGGLSPAAARAAALEEFGDLAAARAELSAMDRQRVERRQRREWWGDVARDVRFAARGLRQQRSFVASAVLTLALGVGATTAVFSVVNAVLLRPPPYPEGDRLVTLAERSEKGGEMRLAAPTVLDWRSLSRSFEGIAAWTAEPTTVLGGSEPARARVAAVTGEFFPLLRARPLLGRTFTADEAAPGGTATAVVGETFWRTRLGGERDLASRRLEIEGTRYEVVGVMPAYVEFPERADVWVPLVLSASAEARSAHNWGAIARLRDGVAVERAGAELSDVQRRLKAQYGSEVDGVAATVRTLQDELVGSARRPLLLLFGAAGLVLLVACTNVASMLLARGAVRQREIGVRAALGAGRGRLVRQLFTESLLLAGLGAAAGLAAGTLVVRLLARLGPEAAGARLATAPALDARAVVFAVLVSVAAALLFGLFPAFRLTEGEVGRSLVTRGVAQGARVRSWNVLVAGEVALAVLLLVGAGLLMRSFARVLRVEPGFDGRGVLTVALSLPQAKYPGDTAVAAAYAALLPELRALPGVGEVGVVNRLPLTGGGLNGGLEIDGRGKGYATYRAASGGYFRALGIPLRRGRLLDDALDRAGAPDAAVVSQSFADRYLGGEDPVGRRIRNLANDSFHYGTARWLTIVGVVGDVRDRSVTADVEPTVYVAAAQRPFRARDAVLTIRGAGDAPPPAAAVRALLRERYASVPAELATMDAVLSGALAARRFTMAVLGLFAATALVLAAVGIYGVVSYRVAQRTQEIGIRIALGAAPRQVRRVVVRDAMAVVGVGLAAGAIGALLMTRLLSSLLYGVSATDPATFAAVPLLLLAAAWAASDLPARRATRVDPAAALRGG